MLIRAADAAGDPSAAQPAIDFIRARGQRDVRVEAILATRLGSR
jgi:hypothetical protein